MSDIQNLDRRLAALPRKVALPFRKLLAAGQLSEEALSNVLDAGDLAGETSMLLGFAVAYLHLRSQGVPVHDVIHMAKHRQRRVNLGWSANRWKLEHDRLSRAEALDRLARDNVAYDISAYEKLLPPFYDGYLIRTSRRLGMEGLRQRHCVASYHNKLMAGNCAIASLFVNRQRWTVELFATGKPESPLRIGQIKTRCNDLPSDEIRNYIHRMLDIDPAPGTEARAGQETGVVRN